MTSFYKTIYHFFISLLIRLFILFTITNSCTMCYMRFWRYIFFTPKFYVWFYYFHNLKIFNPVIKFSSLYIIRIFLIFIGFLFKRYISICLIPISIYN